MVATVLSNSPILKFHAEPVPKFSRHSFLSRTFTIKRDPIISKLCSQKSLFPVKAMSSASSMMASKTEPMVEPYNVLITGSTKGIGYALAREFLKAGDNVVICSRSDDRVKSALETLKIESGKQHLWGTTCDVREGHDVRKLVAFAKEHLKYIDIWAIKMMQTQTRGGHVFNIDGAGSDGQPTPRFAAYGATKRSVVHLTKSLQAELRMQDVNNVVVHNLSPGMVTTDLLMSGANTKQAKFFINVLAEPSEVVAAYLVPNIRSIPSNGSTKPTYIRFLTGLKAYSQIFSRLAFGARRNRYILED